MFTELYIEALLVDGELADLVWEAWNFRLIPDLIAKLTWLEIAWKSPETVDYSQICEF